MGQVIAIAAVADNGVIGNRGKLPWNIPADLQRFKALTTNNIVLMGRKTFESIGGQPLPNRFNIVVSKSMTAIVTRNLLITDQLYETIDKYSLHPTKDLYVIGGGEIYRRCVPNIVDAIELTRVFGYFEGDTYFPDFYSSIFQITDWDNSVPGCRFETYKRRL